MATLATLALAYLWFIVQASIHEHLDEKHNPWSQLGATFWRRPDGFWKEFLFLSVVFNLTPALIILAAIWRAF